MEWVRVDYPQRTRDVFVDGRRSGQTNKTLIVARGKHRFELGLPADYAPRKRELSVQGTSAIQPLVIAFAPDGAGPP
jgi:hypothetical protein